ncbi:MAG: DEAD/DEAH box helicase [Acidimicrobiales bacterium]|nr:DEAD/DEAH box helicase [Acidimicrobiales bacterium]
MSTSPSFASLGVPAFICNALAKRGIHEPFEIQAATIADALAGRDVLGRAPTGSGKTLAFGIPMVANATKARPKRPTALILAPTRELADQIHTELRTFSGDTRIGVVYGGVGYGPANTALRKGVEILVACPGRLEDLIDRGDVTLNQVDHVVLDEADRMADMGFMPAVRRILDQTASGRQTVLFSATLDGDVKRLTQQYQNNPVRHEVGEETPDITAASHRFWKTEKTERIGVTADAVNAVWPAIVFCRTRHGSDRLCKQLSRLGVEAAAIHGGRSQGQRTRALSAFADNKVQALIATDVAARGIHVDGVALVVHYDPPEDHKTYVHRSGRTARAGEGGVVVSLLMPEQLKDAQKVQRQIGLSEPVTTPDAAVLLELSPGPIKVKPKPRPVQEHTRPQGKKQHGNRRGKPGASKNGSSRGASGGSKWETKKPTGKAGSSNGVTRSSNGATRSSNGGAGSNGSKGRSNGSAGRPGAARKAAANRKQRRQHLQRDAS